MNITCMSFAQFYRDLVQKYRITNHARKLVLKFKNVIEETMRSFEPI